MITLFCLLAVFGLGHGLAELPSRHEIETSINRTIDEVERMIREDPTLPRLTRSEIVDVLYNITVNDANSYTDSETLEKARTEYQRALMVVLPYNPKDSNEDLKDLYTRPPMVEMVPDESDTRERVEMVIENGEKEELVYPEDFKRPSFVYGKHLDNSVSSHGTGDSNFENDSKNLYKNHRETYSDVEEPIDFLRAPDESSETTYRGDRQEATLSPETPEKFSFNLEKMESSETTESRKLVSRQPVFTHVTNEIRDSTPSGSKLEIVYSTSVTRRPTMKATTEILQNHDSKFTTPSAKTTQHVLASDQWRYNAPPATTPRPKKISATYRNGSNKTALPVSTTVKPSTEKIPSTSVTTENPEVTLNIRGNNSEKRTEAKPSSEVPSPIYVTPMSSTTSNKSKYSSSYTAASGGLSKDTPVSPPPMREEVQELLASIGLYPGNPDQPAPLEVSHRIPDSNNVIHNQVAGLDNIGIESPSILSQNTFENANADFKKGANNFTPDMQLLFQRFGLQTSQQLDTTTTTTRRPSTAIVNLNPYTNFKPLPTTKVEDDDMRDFLAKFGLGTDENRNEKSMKTVDKAEGTNPSLIEAVPDGMKKILENIGLISRSQKAVDFAPSGGDTLEPTTTPKFHVFKPHETPLHTDEQMDKINKLLDTVRMAQEGGASSQDVQKVANDLLETSKSLQNGPDPLSLEEILNIYNEGLKNEVKRQEDAAAAEGDATTTTTPATTERTPDLTTETTTTSTTANLNLAALADSFGGTTQAPDPVLPSPRRTGLYFLVDWNTFLEVGEEGKDKIDLKFQPKVGDRTRFISVTVP